MKNNSFKKYFLGMLSEQDAETLEKRIISEEDLEAELLEAENDLIEDYLEGNLTSVELKAFNDNFLVTGDRLERVEIVKSLRGNLFHNAENKELKPSFFERIKAFVSLRPLTFAAALLVCVLGIGFIWQTIFRSNINIAHKELIALNKKDLSNLEEFKSLKNLSLVNVALRSGGSQNGILEKDLTENIFLRLALPNLINSNQDFVVKISKDGKLLQTLTQQSQQNQEVRLILPKSMLTKGEYQISLEKDVEKYNYYFSIQ